MQPILHHLPADTHAPRTDIEIQRVLHALYTVCVCVWGGGGGGGGGFCVRVEQSHLLIGVEPWESPYQARSLFQAASGRRL